MTSLISLIKYKILSATILNDSCSVNFFKVISEDLQMQLIAPDTRGYQVNYTFLASPICCGYSLEVPHWGTSNECPHVCVEKYEKYQPFLVEKSTLIGAMWLQRSPAHRPTNPILTNLCEIHCWGTV